MGSSQQSTASTQSNAPWSVQQPYLKTAFNDATSAYGTSTDNTGALGTPSGFTAQYTPAMMDAFRNEMGYGTNTAIAGTSSGIANALANPATSAASSGLYGLSNFNPTGGTDYNIDAANKYAAGFDVPGQVAASMRDANQEYQDVTAPAIDRNSAGSGNINSSTNGIAQGLVQRGLTQKAADLSATLRNSNYQTGLTTAQNTANNQNTSILSALMGAAGGGTSAANSAINAGTGSVGQASGLFNIANAGANNLNSGNQADLTNQLQAWNFGANSPFAALNNYYNIVGNKSWGSQGTGTSTTTSTPSTMSMVGSGLGILGSFF